MINRIRDIRKQKGWTLADLAVLAIEPVGQSWHAPPSPYLPEEHSVHSPPMPGADPGAQGADVVQPLPAGTL